MKLIKKIVKIITLLIFITGCGNTENNDANYGYSFLYQEAEIHVGEVYDENVLGKSISFFESENCAFSEKDITYVYNNFQIQTYENDKHESIIYSIYLINDEVKTKEGLKIYDSFDDMVILYGNDYVNEGNLYTYTKGNCNLNIIVQNGIIESIEYYLNTL